MFIRNGIKSILRERGRTALFSLLIMLLTVTMILSFGVLQYSKAVMVACDEAYRSIALVEYMGAEYPDEDEPDMGARVAANALADETVLSLPGVTAWTRANTTFATAEGYERRSGTVPYGKRAVLVVKNFSDPIDQWVEYEGRNDPVEEAGKITYYTCTVGDSIYSKSGKKGPNIDILTGDTGFVPEKGKSYVLNGVFADTADPARKAGGYPMNGLAIFIVESFISSDEAPYADYREGEAIPEVFLHAAEQYRLMNNYVQVVPCHDVNDVYAFHQNEIRLTEGDMPDPGSPNTCVVSNDLATALGLKPGDTFSLDELRGTEDDRYNLVPNGEVQTYTVSGIATDSPDFRGIVWVIAENEDTPLFGYLLGTVSLSNHEAEASVESLQELVPEQVRVTLLDQGYSNAVQPFREVEKTATNVLIICSVGIVAVLLLFAFLYVGRQQSAVKIMVSMGTPGGKIALWFLSGALVVCGSATVLGAVLGTALRPVVLRIITLVATREYGGYLWYSETVLGVVKELSFDPLIPLWPNLLTVPMFVAITLVFCLWFLRLARRNGIRKGGKNKVHIPRGKSAKVGLGGLGFAILSVCRGGIKSLVVPMVSMVLTVVVLVLGGMYQGWQNDLEEVLGSTSIEGMVVSLDGRYYSGLVLPVNKLRMILGIEGVDDVSVSYGYHYWLAEDEPDFADSSFGREHRQNWISVQPELVTLNSMAAAPEFYYVDYAVTWLEGWDETVLAEGDFKPLNKRVEGKAEEKPIPAVCSDTFLEDHALVLGDTFTCFAQVEHSSTVLKEIPLNIQVVGSYAQQWGKAQIYVPLACHIPLSLLDMNEDPSSVKGWDRYSFRTCRFNLTSDGELDSVRKLLREQNFSAVGRISGNRTTILLRDAAFLRLAENMGRNIVMGKVMFTVISLLIILLGFIISWLMIFARKREFALMRGFGVPKGKVFASFFLEQGILSVFGCIVGCISLLWIYAGGVAQLLAVVAYLLCYLLGATISIRMIGKTNLMELLTIRE